MKKDTLTQIRIAKNLQLLRRQSGLSQEQFADIIEVASPTYANYEQGYRGVPIDTLSLIAKHYHIALDPLVNADLSKIDLKSILKFDGSRLLFPILITQDGKYDSIEVVPVKASAGYLVGYADPEFIETLPRASLPFLGRGQHRGFPITGDSMLPIPDESIVFGKYLENLADVKNGKTYIIVHIDGIVYKRVKVQLEKETMLLISDNRLYKPYEISLRDILEMWEFRCYVSTKEFSPDEFSLENLFLSVNFIANKIDDAIN